MTAQARLLGGRYQVGELLGYGGMAEVHKGRDLRLGRDVAVKMLRTDLARDETFQERFRREAQNSAALNHPAIVAVYDTGEEISAAGERQPFIVMEFVNGRTLKEVLAAEQRLQPRRALEVIADICAALEFSHRHGIIHRDIKPGNVMLTQNGQVKVMDFGIARALASGATTMTQTSAVIGTAQYLSPEQARGESVDARSDVYAAGCVLFELLCGHPPFVGDSPVSVAYQHVREDPKAPSDINPEVPPDVDAIVLKALAKNPLNRYQSAQEMRADALRAVSGRPVMATPVMNEAETMAMAGPPRGYQTGATRPIQAPMMPREPERRTSSWVMAVLAALGVLAVIALAVGLYLTNKGADEPATPTVAMPILTDKTASEAKDVLDRAKLTGIVEGSPSEETSCKKGDVVDQSIVAGTVIPIDKAGTYTVCAGPGQVRVPSDLTGGTYRSVKTTLENAKFKTKQEFEDSDKPEGQVLRLDPPEGSNVEEGSRVTIIVSSGNLKEVPNVVGDEIANARAELQAQGFKVAEKPGEKVGPDDSIVVQRQDPPSQGKAKVGSTVTLTVTVPTEPTPDPSTPEVPDPGQPTTTPPGTDPGTGGGDPGADGGGIGNPVEDLLG